eukprot:8799917-Pyramimonas_sp.AAC.1
MKCEPGLQELSSDWVTVEPQVAMERWFTAAAAALGRLHGVEDRRCFGRAKGCKVHVVPLEASWGRELHGRSQPLAQRWLSLRRLPEGPA